MPSLICSSRYTIDSQILRKTAQALGWETLRLDGYSIPDWFDPPDAEFAFFYTAPHAFHIAEQLDRALIGCNSDWTVNLPFEFLNRELRQTTLDVALRITSPQFVKHSVSKAFPAAVYSVDRLAAETANIHHKSIVHIGEPVDFVCEFRCFVSQQRVKTISPYVYDGQIISDDKSLSNVPRSQLVSARSFAEKVLNHPSVLSTEAFVLDVGIIRDRGWAVVECNECWACGIYGCDPVHVIETLLAAAPSDKIVSPVWDFKQHYWKACPNSDA